jgi:tungstate transport system ATP-binding protein
MITNLESIVTIRGLEVTRGKRFALKIEQLDIINGEVLVIIGPNGAGKSTLLLTITRLLNPHNGIIRFNGQDINKIDELIYRRNLALVLQDSLLFDTTVYNNIATGLRFRGIPKEEKHHRIERWMSKLNITHLKDQPAAQLSGGQAQRVSLARALVLEPKLLLLDEPFRALDSPTRNTLIADLRTLLSETGTTAIFVTHNQDQA